MKQMELFPNLGIKEDERLYILGNGFDIHHNIKSKYSDFKEWVKRNKDIHLISMMDTFFSNECDFWADIENALGNYIEDNVTDFCEPINPEDFKYDHPGQWQAGVEDSIQYIFEGVMDDFKNAFNEWVMNIDIDNIDSDLHLPLSAKYLTFNYTETLEKHYHIVEKNVLHIHGSRLEKESTFIIGHGNYRDSSEPYGNDEILFPYQNANSEVIKIMNNWTKNQDIIIEHHKPFFMALAKCKDVRIMGLSYNDIDLPYIKEVADSVSIDCKWWLYYYNPKDFIKAEETARILGLKDYCLRGFE